MKLNCRLCKSSELTLFLDLGFTPPSDQFLKEEDLQGPITYYPLRVVRCDRCYFIQLDHVVDPLILFQDNYPYVSSTTAAGRAHFDAFADKVVKKFNLGRDDFVIDIGSNVGVLLGGFKRRNLKVLGIDAAPNIAELAEKNGIPTKVALLGHGIGHEVVNVYGKAKVITAANVIAHIDNLDQVMMDVDKILDEDGVFIIESPYLRHLLDNLEFDTIYHEHLSYISLMPLAPFFHNKGYEIFDLDEVTIHGGSLRIYVGRKGMHKISNVVSEFLIAEEQDNIHDLEVLNEFSKNVRKNREDIITLIRKLKSEGKKIAGVSAPAKGMTLLNYCGINKYDLEFVTEKCALKIGKYTPGGNIPVKTDDALIENNIDYALLLAWNFKDEIISNLKAYREKGGKFIVPIPRPDII